MGHQSKLVSLTEAIARHVPSGASILMGAAMEQMIPFSAGHEIIRQNRRDLTLIGPISDVLFDQLIGAGCVARVHGAWVGNVSAGVAYNLRRAVEQGRPRRVEMTDYTNFTLALALHAAALGVPFLPTRSTLGSDVLARNPDLVEFRSPVSEEKLVAVRALAPDVAILHVQRADERGNAHMWGGLGVAIDGARAAKRVIVVAEEIVAPEVIASDPNRTLIPGILVGSVVHDPWGAHPSPAQGYYGRDHEFFSEYHDRSRSAGDFDAWLREYVLSVKDRREYMAKLGDERRRSLEVKEHAPSVPADFGY
jgi:glutaconate CoA-transferase subunit A